MVVSFRRAVIAPLDAAGARFGDLMEYLLRPESIEGTETGLDISGGFLFKGYDLE